MIARRDALEKELAAVDARLEEVGEDADASSRRPSFGLADLGAILLPRRAMGVVMAGVLAGASISSLLAYQLGTGWTVPEADDARVVVVDRGHRAHFVPVGESPREHALRRRKEGEALLMSSLLTSPPMGTEEATPRITRIGPTTWEVDESVLDASGPPYTTVRMIPHLTREGRVDGIRLLGVRPDGIQARLGLRNGDVVLRANGIEMTGADGAFAAVESMRRTHHLALELQRDGRVVAHHYMIASADRTR